MDAAWDSNKPADGNAGAETLANLGRTVEATKVAVAHVLQISGHALKADFSASATAPQEVFQTLTQGQ